MDINDPIEESLNLRKAKGGFYTYVIRQHPGVSPAQVPFKLNFKTPVFEHNVNLFDS